MAGGKDTGSWAYKQANSKEHHEMMIGLAWDDFYAKVVASLRTGGEGAKHAELQPQ